MEISTFITLRTLLGLDMFNCSSESNLGSNVDMRILIYGILSIKSITTSANSFAKPSDSAPLSTSDLCVFKAMFRASLPRPCISTIRSFSGSTRPIFTLKSSNFMAGITITGMLSSSDKSASVKLLTTLEVPKIISLLAKAGGVFEVARGSFCCWAAGFSEV
jgi:hypothetical protein